MKTLIQLILILMLLASCKAYEDSILQIREIKPDSDTVLCTNLAGEEVIVLNSYDWNIRVGMSLKEKNRFSEQYFYDDIVSCDSINFE